MKVRCVNVDNVCGNYVLGKIYDVIALDLEDEDVPYLLADEDMDRVWEDTGSFVLADPFKLGTSFECSSNSFYTTEDIHEFISKLPSEINGEFKSTEDMIKIKYFEGAKKLQHISKGDWVDVYTNKDVVIAEGESCLIPLGFALELPKGYEAHLIMRSSTFKNWGIIQTNGMGIIDNSYCGDNDEWLISAYCLRGDEKTGTTVIPKGTKIAQFRIMENQPKFMFVEVDSLRNKDRNGFGSTGIN